MGVVNITVYDFVQYVQCASGNRPRLGVTDQHAAIGQRGQGVDLQHGAVALDEDLKRGS